jgi:hypothetical protein
MTHADLRAQCIEAMARTLCDRNEPGPVWRDYVPDATGAFDALHGIAFVNGMNCTVEMIDAGTEAERLQLPVGLLFRRMAAAGDLTQHPAP